MVATTGGGNHPPTVRYCSFCVGGDRGQAVGFPPCADSEIIRTDLSGGGYGLGYCVFFEYRLLASGLGALLTK
jgi:hypothetical protein